MCVQDDYRAIESADDVFDTLVSLPYNTAPYSPSRAVTLRSYRLAAPPPHISYRSVPAHRLRSSRSACRAAGRGTGRASRSIFSDAVLAMRCPNQVPAISIRKTPPSHIGSSDTTSQYLIGLSTGRTTNGTVSSDLFYSVPPISPVKLEARAWSPLSSRFSSCSPTRGTGRFFLPPIPICDLCALPSISHAISTLPNI